MFWLMVLEASVCGGWFYCSSTCGKTEAWCKVVKGNCQPKIARRQRVRRGAGGADVPSQM